MAALGSYQFGSSQVIALRPLSTGMVTEGSDVLLKSGSVKNLEGFDVTERGLRRIGGFSSMFTGPVTMLFDDAQPNPLRRLGEIPEDFTSLTLEDGDTRSIVITNRTIYTFDPSSGFAPVYWKKVFMVKSYSVPVNDAVVVVSGDEITESALTTGDWVLFDTSTDMFLVTGVSYDAMNLETTLTVAGHPSVVPTTFKVVKPFKTGDYRTGWCLGRNALWLVDGISPIVFRYDGVWLKPVKVQESASNTTRTMYGAKVIATFRDRLWFGDVQDGSAGSLKAHQRIRWSEVLGWVPTIDYIESPAVNYQDLAGHVGGVEQIVGLEELIVAFTTDAVFYGQQTSLAGLPYAFMQIQTGGVSIVGPKAVTGLLGSIVFVGQDDVYLLGLDQGYPTLSKIATPVANQMLPPKYPKRVVVVSDALNSRILVGMANELESVLDTLWIWNYRTKGWSKETDLSFRSIVSSSFADLMRWSELNPTWTFNSSPISSESFDSFMNTVGYAEVYAYDTNNYLLRYRRDSTAHTVYLGGVRTTVPVQFKVELPDMDFDLPDNDKTYLSFGVRLHEDGLRTETFTMSVEGSTDHGQTWKSLGVLTFAPTDKEDSINFRMTGPTGRFRISGVSGVCAPWTIVEITIRVRLRGYEAQRGTSRVLP